jgi:SAM-dependent methyltransferase
MTDVPDNVPAAVVRARFEDIYSAGGWGGLGSGPGSLRANARPYVEFVSDVLRRHRVSSVVDIGCGDWQMWPPQTFDDVETYVGFDVVESVIEKNRALVGSVTREFHVADATQVPLPKADLLLCKEVLQHLPNAVVHRFLQTVLSSFPIVVICDDTWMGSSSSWRRAVRGAWNALASPASNVNQDIEPGGYRPIDYTLPPFADLSLVRCLTYESLSPPRCRTLKTIWSLAQLSGAG